MSNSEKIVALVQAARFAVLVTEPIVARELHVILGKEAPNAGALLYAAYQTVLIRVAGIDHQIGKLEAAFYRDALANVFGEASLQRMSTDAVQLAMLAKRGRDPDLQQEAMPVLRALQLVRGSSDPKATEYADVLADSLGEVGRFMASLSKQNQQKKLSEVERLISMSSNVFHKKASGDDDEIPGVSKKTISEAAQQFAEIEREVLAVLIPLSVENWDVNARKNAVKADFLILATRLVGADMTDAANKVRVIRKVLKLPRDKRFDWLMVGDIETAAVATIRAQVDDTGSILNPMSREPASMLNVLRAVDRQRGTDLAGKYGASLFRFGNVVARANGVITDSEAAVLRHFIPEGSESHKPDTPALPPAKTADMSPAKVGESADVDLDSALLELRELIGLAPVKREIERLTSFVRVQKLRKARGLKGSEIALHTVFSGNPGTGKTTVARLLARIYKSLGVVSQGHLVETDRAGLVAGFVGQTAPKTDEVVQRAKGGVLFIDEAYSLSSSEYSNDFGREAIETLLKRMEDFRDDLVVIVAGYTQEMKDFLKSNPGLSSRFAQSLSFPDYSPGELEQIFDLYCKQQQYTLSPSARERLRALVLDAHNARDQHFGNARFIRNVFEKAINAQAHRVVGIPMITTEILTTIESEDLTH